MTSKLTITDERLEKIKSWRETYGAGSNVILPAEEAEELARIALAVIDSEPVRNPVLAYADSYRDMAKQGVESVPIWSVITDLERNIAPLYRHAQPAQVVMDEAQSRAAFEQWCTVNIERNKWHPEFYAHLPAREQWAAWKAAGAELVEALEKAQQRITQLESRTVKLPEPFKLAKSSSGLAYYFADDVDAALTAAGIKWEAE
ncbi:hypothetical protein LLZ89_27090 [Klebsiella michiganensis]|uniref:hypothetical protein n=1 Tax=Klebsiella michiganensis TaxID=1134687 RepID=UPI001F3307A3|nr:hypothetical protein [Klebsiella michiganensis]UIU17795.1 hypothetical protein LLZ89_27090 [Klebsiella michiganensis]